MSHFVDVQLAMLEFDTKLWKCIRMGISIFRIIIWGGISLDIRPEITDYSSASVSL